MLCMTALEARSVPTLRQTDEKMIKRLRKIFPEVKSSIKYKKINPNRFGRSKATIAQNMEMPDCSP